MCSENRVREIDDRRIAAGHDAQLRREQKVVEGAAANEVEEIHNRNVPPYAGWVLATCFCSVSSLVTFRIDRTTPSMAV